MKEDHRIKSKTSLEKTGNIETEASVLFNRNSTNLGIDFTFKTMFRIVFKTVFKAMFKTVFKIVFKTVFKTVFKIVFKTVFETKLKR